MRQLRYFLAAADELHFGRAARRLGITQQNLSAQLQALERRLEVRLFDRPGRRVVLTDAGRRLQDTAPAVLRAAERATLAVRGEDTPRRVLRVSYFEHAARDYTHRLLAQLRQTRADIRVELIAYPYAQHLGAVRTGDADAALGWPPYSPAELDGLTCTQLTTEPRVAVLPAAHRLAERGDLHIADLAEETFLPPADGVSQEWSDFWTLTGERGHRGRYATHAGPRSSREALELIARGKGITTCTASIAAVHSWPDLRFIPVLDAPPATLALIAPHPYDTDITALLDAARTVAATSPGFSTAVSSPRPPHPPADSTLKS